MTVTRRHFVRQALGIAAVASAGMPRFDAVAQEAAVTCYDPVKLPFTQKSRRRALGYVDASKDPARRCGLCAFFTGTAAGCGTCQMLSGGPVAASGLCNSFAAKPAR
ncbi:MAG TPA: high-potential iron-sulfur protein [Novosphingobium sp.]|nr:high-potential iron-sulfur protein [Novosphingobium sp.]